MYDAHCMMAVLTVLALSDEMQVYVKYSPQGWSWRSITLTPRVLLVVTVVREWTWKQSQRDHHESERVKIDSVKSIRACRMGIPVVKQRRSANSLQPTGEQGYRGLYGRLK